MTLHEVTLWLEELRNQKDFDTLKEVRDKCRKLIAVNNRDWFKNINQTQEHR